MRIFTRYILREVISYALLGGLLFTFVLFMPHLKDILELVVRDSASTSDVLRLLLYTLPNTLTVTIPMAVLVGILLGLSRLAADSEITAMRASGIGALSFVRIVSILATFALLLGLANSLYLSPKSAASLLGLENELKNSQASFEVQPRVFYEDFKNYVLYVQDVRPAQGVALWRHVFLADLTQPATPHITTAEEAVVQNAATGSSAASPSGANESAQGSLALRMINGGQHEISASNADQYTISTFSTTDMPLATGDQEEAHVSRSDTPILALGLHELWVRSQNPDPKAARPYRIELNKRFSYPFACLVLMLVGVPLGLSSKRGGKSAGFVVTIMLVFVYYFLSSIGVALAKSDKLTPLLGVWGANILFTLAGVFLLQQMSRGGAAINLVSSASAAARKFFDELPDRPEPTLLLRIQRWLPNLQASFHSLRRALPTRFPLILDEYIMGQYLKNIGLVLLSFVMLFEVFTFFELIGDIIRNRTPLVTVGLYLLNLIPFILSNVVPLCSLVAVLITFGALNRSSELTAMKATGVSLYRVVTPVLVLAAILAAGLFTFDEVYLPGANRRQEALRSVIKGKPAQTFLRPDRKWISGQSTDDSSPNARPVAATRTETPTRIFYYQFFDPDKNVFANLTVFEFHPGTFALQRRIFATSARWDPAVDRWVFENGWQRSFTGETVASYQPFTLASFPEIHEQPGYFKKETRQSQEMSYTELERYIADLKQSGFDTMRLRVQLQRKLANPLVTLVMAVLAIPFSLSMGKRGGLAGIATAIGIAICYWTISGIFEAMGNVGTLPPLLAAWSPDLLFALAGSYLLLRTPT